MMIKNIARISVLVLVVFNACKPAITPEVLYGKWNYTRLEKPNAHPASVEPDWKLKLEKPYVLFLKNNEMQMWWSGELFAHGKFSVKDNDIWFNQVFDGGQTREFPFHIVELKDGTMVFETSGEDGSKVTVVKQ